VHRDVKPQNLFLAERAGGAQTWMVLDFGIARVADSSGTLTEGHVVGTPGYMSPEQALGQSGDARADLFALGAVVYRALTGSVPFTGEGMPQVLHAIAYASPIRPRELAPELPHDVERFLAIALAKRPADRFESAPQLAEAMRRAAEGKLPGSMRERAHALTAEFPWQTRG
jgi:serine/threonine-protein kinase